MNEEREHLARYLDRVLFLQGSTTMVPDPLRIGADVGSIFAADLAGEMDAIKLYTEAAAYCQEVGDYVSRGIFELTLADEQEHANYLETQISLVARLGIEAHAGAGETLMTDRWEPWVTKDDPSPSSVHVDVPLGSDAKPPKKKKPKAKRTP